MQDKAMECKACVYACVRACGYTVRICGCLCIQMCVLFCTCVHMWLCMHSRLWLYGFVCARVCVTYAYMWGVCTHVGECVFIHVCVCTPVHQCRHACACDWVHKFVHVFEHKQQIAACRVQREETRTEIFCWQSLWPHKLFTVTWKLMLCH